MNQIFDTLKSTFGNRNSQISSLIHSYTHQPIHFFMQNEPNKTLRRLNKNNKLQIINNKLRGFTPNFLQISTRLRRLLPLFLLLLLSFSSLFYTFRHVFQLLNLNTLNSMYNKDLHQFTYLHKAVFTPKHPSRQEFISPLFRGKKCKKNPNRKLTLSPRRSRSMVPARRETQFQNFKNRAMRICKTNPIQRLTLSRRRSPGAPGKPISLIHPFTHLLIHSFTHSCKTNPISHIHIYSFTHSLIYAKQTQSNSPKAQQK